MDRYWPMCFSFLKTSKNRRKPISVILLKIDMVRPGTHLVKNYESQSRTNELKKEPEIKNAWAFMQPDNYNLKTDIKTLHYRVH